MMAFSWADTIGRLRKNIWFHLIGLANQMVGLVLANLSDIDCP